MSSGNTRPPQPAAPKLSLVPPTNPISSMIRLMQGKSLYLAVTNTLRTIILTHTNMRLITVTLTEALILEIELKPSRDRNSLTVTKHKSVCVTDVYVHHLHVDNFFTIVTSITYTLSPL